jgi:2-polyprenyl-3-methyl-5-hydroxy-6-metoxy-1,4-benzoquinol methylase
VTPEAGTVNSDAGPELRARRFGGYEKPRREIERLVPQEARRVLDVGCASGALGAAIKARGDGISVAGIELGQDYAAMAQDVLDVVVQGDAQQMLTAPDLQQRVGGDLDCVIAADVLEHLPDPYAALSGAVRLLRPGGTAVVSLPNVRFWQTFWYVGVRGTWPRRDVGLFDRTHLQWFTARDAVELLEQSGLEVTRVKPWLKLRYSATRIDTLLLPVLKRLPGPLKEFFSAQTLLVGRKPA